MWFYVQYVLIGHQMADAALHATPRGNLSDLYPRWLGARELLLHHRDPYNVEITREIQIGYYGRPLDPKRPNDPKDQEGFAYPVYVTFLLAPTIFLPFDTVQAGFRWFLVVLTVATVFLWLRPLRWRPPLTTMATLMVLAMGSFPVLQGIKLQQLSLLVGALIAGSAALLAADHLLMAGVLLALATIKPQLVLPVAGWVLLWVFSNWQKRQNFVWGFGLTMAFFLAASEYLLPGWIGRFRGAVAAYRQYTGAGQSVLEVLLSPWWGRALAVLILLALAVACWRMRQFRADATSFSLLLVPVLAATVLILPTAAPYNQVLLLPAVFFVVQHWQLLWNKNRLARITAVISGLVIAWPWLAAIVLTVAALFLPAKSVQEAWMVPLWTSLAIPPAVLLLLLSVYLSDPVDYEQKLR